MLPVKADFAVEHGGVKQSGKIVLALVLTTCSLFWTGCSGISQGSSASSQTPAQHLSGQTALPGATVGSSYADVLSVSGGRSPYNFVVSEGSLPAGLALNARTGSISGIPTRAGSFAFTISVTDGSSTASDEGGRFGGQTARAYSITVSPSKTPAAIQISPADPSIAPGGRIQFTASNGGNIPIRWAASAGTISSTGLFTAPVTGSAKLITITASSVKTNGMQASTAVTISNANPVKVQISPTNPSIVAGGKVQFSAAVSNTSNTAVTWSASAGSISPAGLFTAPASGSVKSITITASSAALSSAQASTAVAVSSPTITPAFAITTSSLPGAVQSTPYSASLAASGGQPPYRWALVSGSLPAGVQLNPATGTLSGSPGQSGTFPLSIRGTDAAAHTAQQNLSLLVSALTSGTNCGPPSYSCSRSDLAIVPVPTPPSVGGLSGANSIVRDPDFGSRIVRVTDANTNPAAANVNMTFVTTSSGSADDNLWNVDSTLFTVQDTWADTYVYSFNPSTLQASRLYVSSFPATNGLMLSSSGNWSRVNSNLLYTNAGTAYYKYDFTDRTNPPSPQLLYDFTSSPNCLPAGFTATWYTKGGVSGDDTVFAMAYSNTGDQGTGVYAVVYKVGSGCSLLNTQTGHVSGDWGANGTINIADRWTIHNVKLSKDGNWLIIESTTCTSSTCTAEPYFWQVGTTTVNSCGQGGSCGGHFTEGYSHWVNNDNSPMSNQVERAFAQPTSITNLTNSFPQGITPPFDQHQSWNNVDAADSLPFFAVTWSTTTPFPAPWYNEIIAVAADGSGKTWRFAHDFTSTHSQRFSTEWGIGTISQDGRFFIFSSDWMGQLGSESGTAACTIGTDCRGDVFVVELK
jgi:hypothetical protein